MIYHICLKKEYKAFELNNFYEAPSLKIEGFIHCSTKNQLAATVKRYYAEEEMVQLLAINEAKLTAELKYEFATSVNEDFPHIFGQINKDAIESIITIYLSDSEEEILKKIN